MISQAMVATMLVAMLDMAVIQTVQGPAQPQFHVQGAGFLCVTVEPLSHEAGLPHLSIWKWFSSDTLFPMF